MQTGIPNEISILSPLGRLRGADTATYDYLDIAVSLKENTDTWFDMNGTQLNKVRELSESEFAIAVYVEISPKQTPLFRVKLTPVFRSKLPQVFGVN